MSKIQSSSNTSSKNLTESSPLSKTNSSQVHPLAVDTFKNVKLSGPMKRIYFSENSTCKYDLTNSTNPFTGIYAEYPILNPLELKKAYLEALAQVQHHFYPTIPMPKIDLTQLLFTVGSIEGIDLLLRAFCDPKQDVVCSLDPSFPAYGHWAKLQGVEIKYIPMRGDNFGLIDLQEIIKINPKIMFICNPNNPTGTVIPNKVILDVCKAIKGLVVVDEAYIEFADQPSMLHHLNETENLVILRTTSKGWGMAGLRCGMVFADPRILNTLRYVQIPFGLSIPAQNLMFKNFKAPQKIIHSWTLIKNERDWLYEKLLISPAIEKIYKSQANFLFMKLRKGASTLKKLEENGIAVSDCGHFYPNYIKVSIAKPEAHRAFLKVLASS